MIRFSWFALFVALLLAPALAAAEPGLLVLVTEIDEAGAPSFWWAGATPAWTTADAHLRDALEREGGGFAAPATIANLSKIYRRPDPSDANALAMASVLGHDRVLVGTATVSRSQLAPLGSVGVSVRLEARLVAAGNGAPEVVSRLDLTRVSWAQTEDEARKGAHAAAARRQELLERRARLLDRARARCRPGARSSRPLVCPSANAFSLI